jgi:MoaA/NifB/PqqE/SkfB family radical SAM enzyme
MQVKNLIESFVRGIRKKYRYSTTCHRYPLFLEVELIRGCNIWPPCPMCALNAIAGDSGFRPMKNLDIAILEQNKDLFLNSAYLFFCGFGEVLLSKTFYYYLDNFDPRTPISFFSNGQLLRRDVVHSLIKHTMRDVGFSIDAGTEETYRKIRGHGSYTLEKTLRNIEYLVKKLAETGGETKVMMLFVIMKENYLELPVFIENGIRIGVRHFRTWHMRASSDENDYRVHDRNGFHFDCKEQSILGNRALYEDFKLVREQCYEIAARNDVIFETEYNRDNEFYLENG